MNQAQLDAEVDDWEGKKRPRRKGHPPYLRLYVHKALHHTLRLPQIELRLLDLLPLRWQLAMQEPIERSGRGVDSDPETPLRATPCFTGYLASKKGQDLQTIDIEILRRKMMGLKRRGGDDIPKGDVFHEEGFDDTVRAWKDRWKVLLLFLQGSMGAEQQYVALQVMWVV
ncbi:MAG: hypothetical protein ASARMPREDX12_009579 [Alectoria sarmentosa]|nr:MAG: hypothetical protein ASARMPREDX12_009579 [Alectoria sarmentosa]